VSKASLFVTVLCLSGSTSQFTGNKKQWPNIVLISAIDSDHSHAQAHSVPYAVQLADALLVGGAISVAKRTFIRGPDL
jgi:hypothetical protein